MDTIDALEAAIMVSAIMSILSFLMLVSITISLVILRDKLDKAINVLKVGLEVEEEKKSKRRAKKDKKRKENSSKDTV